MVNWASANNSQLNLFKLQQFSSKELYLKKSSAERRSFRFGLNLVKSNLLCVEAGAPYGVMKLLKKNGSCGGLFPHGHNPLIHPALMQWCIITIIDCLFVCWYHHQFHFGSHCRTGMPFRCHTERIDYINSIRIESFISHICVVFTLTFIWPYVPVLSYADVLPHIGVLSIRTIIWRQIINPPLHTHNMHPTFLAFVHWTSLVFLV